MGLFETVAQRDRYFANCDSDPRFVALGAAMSQASINLGIWGDVNTLKRDCAKLMRYEIINFTHGLPNVGVCLDPAVDNVLQSDVFNRAFADARGGDDISRLNLLAQLGHNADNDTLKKSAQRELADKIGPLTEADLDLLRGALPDKDKWEDTPMPPEIELCIDVISDIIYADTGDTQRFLRARDNG